MKISKTTTIISSKNELKQGLFGEVFLYLFEILPILEKNRVDISFLHWDISTKSYGTIFPNLLEYKAANKINWFSKTRKFKLKDLRKLKPQYVLGDDFEQLNSLFFKYFSLPEKLDIIASSYNLENSLGIHFRGTDKTADTSMNTALSKKDFYSIFDSYVKTNNTKSVFLATDEVDIFDYLTHHYTDIEIKKSRDFSGRNIFWKHNPNTISNGQEAIIDMLCLSKCNTVLKISSALSSFSKVINPQLNIFRLNASKMFADIPYFPDAYIPLLKKNHSFSEECNNILEKIQQDDWSNIHQDKFNNFYFKER